MTCCLFLFTVLIYSQSVTECDSAFIFKHFLFYHSDSKTFDDIDEPFIEEYWTSENVKAQKYYYLSAFLKTIPVDQRVIMLSYLDDNQKNKGHYWIYNNLRTARDTIEYFLIMNTNYGIPYSHLNIPERTVMKYCTKCKYR